MGIKISRKKKPNFLLTLSYKLKYLLFFLSKKQRFALYLNLEWIFNRFAHELSFSIYSEKDHPFRLTTVKFINQFLNNEMIVLDLGCKYGELSNILALQCKHVIAIDHDKEAIAIAKKLQKQDNIEFITAEASEYLKTFNKKIDVLFLSHILEHIDNPTDFLSQYSQYFDYCYIEVPDFEYSYLNKYRQDLDLSLIYSDNDHVWEFSAKDLVDILFSSNVEIIKIEKQFGNIRIWGKFSSNL